MTTDKKEPKRLCDPTDEELIQFAVEEQFLLFCYEEEFIQIAREVLHKWGRKHAAELAAVTAARDGLLNPWVSVGERLPEDGVEVIGYHPDWIDADFNPEGIRVCFQNDGERWHSARWYDSQDCYINGDERVFGDDPDGSLAPAMWAHIPAPPKDQGHE